MKNLFYFLLFSFAPIFVTAQIHVVAPNGDTGVGTTTPSEKLEVDGNAKINGNTVFLGPDAGFEFFRSNLGSSQFRHSGTTQFSFRALDNAGVTFYTNNTVKMQVTKTGDLKLYTGEAYKLGTATWAPLSDQRLKQNIKNYSSGIDELMKVNPVTFEYNEKVMDNGEEYVGVIAQEIEKVSPSMIRDFELEDRDGNGTGEMYMAVNPNDFIYMLINATKSQQSKIEEQQSTIESQTEKIEDMQSELREIKDLLQSGKGFAENTETGMEDKAILKQNAPNPFSKVTTIAYYLPEVSRTASIKVFDLVGKELKSLKLTKKGNSNIELNVEDLSNGMYLYSLIVDGKIIDSKQMILE